MRYLDMAQIKRVTRGYWFSPDTMRFFRSRVGSTAYGTDDGLWAFFVSSEQAPGDIRRWTVRACFLPTGTIEDASEFGQYGSWSGADKAAQRFARNPDLLPKLRMIEQEQSDLVEA